MSRTYCYDTSASGACCSRIEVDLSGDRIDGIRIIGGCAGNHLGLQALARGREAKEVIGLLEGIPCQNGTSCPDQLALALRDACAAVEN